MHSHTVTGLDCMLLYTWRYTIRISLLIPTYTTSQLSSSLAKPLLLWLMRPSLIKSLASVAASSQKSQKETNLKPCQVLAIRVDRVLPYQELAKSPNSVAASSQKSQKETNLKPCQVLAIRVDRVLPYQELAKSPNSVAASSPRT